MTCKEAAKVGQDMGFPGYSAAAHSLASRPDFSGVTWVPELREVFTRKEGRMSQKELVLNYMDEHGSIDPLRAIRDLGILRLGARIHELKAEGWPIVTETRTRKYPDGTRKTWAEYKIAAPSGGTPETAND